MVRWSCTPVKLWCAFAGLNRTSGYSGAKMMRVHSPRAQDERAPAPAPATSFADAVLKAPEPPRERFKWTAQRTVLYVVAFGILARSAHLADGVHSFIHQSIITHRQYLLAMTEHAHTLPRQVPSQHAPG